MTRLEVVNNILGLLRRSDCTPDLALSFLQQGIVRTQRQLRVPSMERVVHLTPASTMHSITIPNDLLQVSDVVANGLPLDKVPHRTMLQTAFRKAGAVGQPTQYSRYGTGLYFYPALEATGDIVLAYYGTLGALPDDASENEGTEAFPDLLSYAALTFAGDWFRHDESDRWEAKFQTLLTETQDAAIQIDATGGPEAVQSAYGET